MMAWTRAVTVEVVKKKKKKGQILGYNLKVDENTCSDDSHDLSWSGNNMRIKIMTLIAQEEKINLRSTTSLRDLGQAV